MKNLCRVYWSFHRVIVIASCFFFAYSFRTFFYFSPKLNSPIYAVLIFRFSLPALGPRIWSHASLFAPML